MRQPHMVVTREWQTTVSRREYPGNNLGKEPEPSKINKPMPETPHIFIYIPHINDTSVMLVRKICRHHTSRLIGQLFLALKDDMQTPITSWVQVRLCLSGEAPDSPPRVRLTTCPGPWLELLFADLGCHSDSDSQVFGRKLTPSPPPGGVVIE